MSTAAELTSGGAAGGDGDSGVERRGGEDRIGVVKEEDE